MTAVVEAPRTMKRQRATSQLQAQASTGPDRATVIGGYGVQYGTLNDYGRVFVHGAFAESLGDSSDEKPIPIGWLHEVPIGKWTTTRDEEQGPYLEGPLSQTSAGQDAAILARDGLTAISVGFVPLVYQFAEPNERVSFDTPYGTRSYQFDTFVCYMVKAELEECSLVLVGADDNARITYVQSLLSKADQALPGLSTGSSWEDTAYSMALLMGGRGAAAFSELPDLEHFALYQKLAAAYKRHGKTPPEYARDPKYSSVAFQHDEREVFHDRYLRKTLAAVQSGAAGHQGQLSPETREAAEAVIGALQSLTTRKSEPELLAEICESLRQTTASLERT